MREMAVYKSASSHVDGSEMRVVNLTFSSLIGSEAVNISCKLVNVFSQRVALLLLAGSGSA
jgi:hypothetical protein